MSTELVIVEEEPEGGGEGAPSRLRTDEEWENLERGVGQIVVFVFGTVGALCDELETLSLYTQTAAE